MKDKKQQSVPRLTTKKLVMLNVVALLTLLLVTLLVLWATGLLGSVIAFIF